MLKGRFEVKSDRDGRTHFNLFACNGQVILQSEMHGSKQGALNAIESIKKNAGKDERYTKMASIDKYYFTLKAGNGQVIAHSQMYETEISRDNGIESVKKNAPDADVVER